MIVGSARKNSFNMQLAKEAEKLLEKKAVVSYLNYEDVPFLNQDGEYPAPEAVSRAREAFSAADGIFIVTPEYNSSYPGLLKNLLDWMSRPFKPGDYAGGTAISGKKAAIAGAAGRSAAAGARAKLRELLGFIGAEVLAEETGVALSGEAFQTGQLSLSETEAESLRKETAAFLERL